MFENFGPVIFFCTVIIGLLVMYEVRKSNSAKQASKDDFWSREARANTVRRKDISYLNYIEIPYDKLPFKETEDDELLEYHNTINKLKDKKILNLSEYSNTDLKEKYGVANLTVLSEYDDNFARLVNTLTKWGARLIDMDCPEDATTVLEYSICIGSDISRGYVLLADLYRKNNEVAKLDSLIEKANTLNSLMKPSLLNKLAEIRSYLND